MLQKVRWGPHYGPFLWSLASGYGLWYPAGLTGTVLFVLSPGRDQHSKASYRHMLISPYLGLNVLFAIKKSDGVRGKQWLET